MAYQIKNIKGSDVSINGENFVNGASVNLVDTTAVQSPEWAAKLIEHIGINDFQLLNGVTVLDFGESSSVINKCMQLYAGRSYVNDRQLENEYFTANPL